MNTYKLITVNDIINFVNRHPKFYPKGLDTPVYSGDFEGNCTHGLHELQTMKKEKGEDAVVKENSICLGYEMHENIYEW